MRFEYVPNTTAAGKFARGMKGGNGMAAEDWTSDVAFAVSVVLVVVEVLGLVCNIVILTVYYRHSKLRTATNLFILNLACCNLMLAALELLLSTPSFFQKEWLYGHRACVAYGLLHEYLVTVAIVTVGAIAFDRYCVITKPVRNFRMLVVTKSCACALIVTAHVYSLCFTVPLIAGWGELVADERYNTGCFIHYSDRSDRALSYAVTSTLFTCFVPLALMVYCYSNIYKSVRRSSRRCTIYKRGSRDSRIASRGSRLVGKSPYHARTARMIVAVMFFFLLSWLPTRTAGLCSALGHPVSPLASFLAAFLAKSSVMYNVVVYVFLNRRFRAAFLRMTLLVCRRDENAMRFTTTNASMRNAPGDVTQSAMDASERSKSALEKRISQLAIVPNLSDGAATRSSRALSEILAETGGRNLSFYGCHPSLPRNASETFAEVSETSVKCSENDVIAEADSAESGICSYTNEGMDFTEENDLGLENQSLGHEQAHGPGIERYVPSAWLHQDRVLRNGSSAKEWAQIRGRANTTDGLPQRRKAIHEVVNKRPKSGLVDFTTQDSIMKYGFNNPILYDNVALDESMSGKSMKTYLELDIACLGNYKS